MSEVGTTTAAWVGKVRLAEADARPGRYYVTARDGGRTAFLLGPFTQPTWGKEAHARANGALAAARRYCSDNFAKGPFFQYGTCWMPLLGPAPEGKLNGKVAI